MRRTERKFHDDEAAYLGPVAMAQFIDIGWLQHWPLAWTHVGRRALRNGYGTWTGQYQRLPYPTEQNSRAVPHWLGRRVAVPNR